jgi:CheY-like chemotaxis protein
MADLLGPTAGQKGLEFVVRMAPDLPKMVVGDAGRIRQILMNLAGNAIKFTHSGHVLVEAEMLDSTETQCRIRFSVHDTGIGIPANKIDTLFEKFTQADSSTTRRYGGTGLGLAISRKLVELMGGTMRVDSVAGQGSTFSFDVSFPRIAGTSQHAIPVVVSGPKARVLLIEPHPISARVISEMLDTLGLEHRTTATAADAAAIVEKDPAYWHAILASSRAQADQPGEFVRLQRLLGKGNRLILLATRGRADSIAQTRILRVLHKPIQPAVLEETLKLTLSDSLAIAQRLEPPSIMSGDLKQLSLAVHRESASALRVLVAEDNIVNQTIVKKLLEEAGCRVDVANNGVQAIDRWEEGGYDLILMDCQMPELDGFDATREIRKREGGRERVPIVAITANVLDKDRNHCFAVGMDDFLSKPLRLRQLREVVTRWSPAERANQAALKVAADA